ncbi:HD domain-containing protein [Trametes pubescens]|uniref:HD domain-containing protein n=1 Tax=Trametes pubescens TaxID=154538 RepID=A0A1M2V6U9_TRAPU|nr:HD domain-containing protein [Trametes pubescens]
MHNFVHEMLHNSSAARRIEALWQEYEEGESKEAKFVKDLDRFEMACQASEYERNHGMQTLQPFFDSSLPLIRHPEVQGWGQALATERQHSQSKRDEASSS